MMVFLNGQFVPEEQAVVSVFDRSFLYGDGLFETLRIVRGKPLFWKEHINRLQQGAEFLKISFPFSEEELCHYASALIEKNSLPNALLRITLSRGVGVRGYSSRGANQPFLVMTLASAPEKKEAMSPQWRVITAARRLPVDEPLTQFKTCNKLPQILARAEAEASGADEALLLNTRGEVVEAASGNLFWIESEIVFTPPLCSGILAGVTRAAILEVCNDLSIATKESCITQKQLTETDGVFLSLSSLGVVEIISLDDMPLKRSGLVQKIREAYNLVAES